MKIEGIALAGSTEIISTKKRGDLQKTKLKVMDMGAEANGGTCIGSTSSAKQP